MRVYDTFASAEAVQHGRLIDADALTELLKARKQFFVDSYGGSFNRMIEKDKARCDEIDACIASIVNAPTVVDIPEPCQKCSNHPSNGGSGICQCILGNNKITV